MPFKIVREDITKIECDAIVNPTNRKFIPTGGVDLAIHKGAGIELFKICKALGGLKVGEAKLTPAYNLPCKFVIHTVGPKWKGGKKNEKELLQSCYRETLKIAKGTKCESVAFPLIASGLHGYPKDQVMQVALEVIKEFLYENDMLIYLVVYDKTAYSLSEKLSCGVKAYIDDNYVNAQERYSRIMSEFQCERMERMRRLDDVDYARVGRRSTEQESYFDVGLPIDEDKESDLSFESNPYEPKFGSVNTIEKYMREGFKETLLGYVDKRGITDVACYKGANVSRQTWHKIITDKYYTPKKNPAIALAISLKLNLEETQALLETAGFVLSKSSLFDVIIMFCIVKGIYDVFEIDSILFQYDQETLFSKE